MLCEGLWLQGTAHLYSGFGPNDESNYLCCYLLKTVFRPFYSIDEKWLYVVCRNSLHSNVSCSAICLGLLMYRGTIYVLCSSQCGVIPDDYGVGF